MNLKQLIQASSLPQLEAEILISFIIKKPREFVIVHQDYKISELNQKKFLIAEKKRLNHEPIAYLISYKEFYGLKFKVDKNVLIPRPETEMLVDLVLDYANSQIKDLNFIDIGTGSGAIIISLVKNCKQKYSNVYDSASFTALDISAAALNIAKFNSKQQELNKKIEFVESDLLGSLKPEELVEKDLVITANLPYLTPYQVKSEPSISKEPKLALDGGAGGLKYYKRLLKDLKQIKFTSLFLILEINPKQTQEIKKLIKKQWPNSKPKIIKDLRKQNRFVLVEIKR
ncbi:MAG: peptide chain release factor N(5)-glutamine methyltransferase [Patescibacteria group bacterium]